MTGPETDDVAVLEVAVGESTCAAGEPTRAVVMRPQWCARVIDVSPPRVDTGATGRTDATGGRAMKDIRCMVGRHAWHREVNPGVGGQEGIRDVCTRCGTDKKTYGPPTYAKRGIPG